MENREKTSLQGSYYQFYILTLQYSLTHWTALLVGNANFPRYLKSNYDY